MSYEITDPAQRDEVLRALLPAWFDLSGTGYHEGAYVSLDATTSGDESVTFGQGASGAGLGAAFGYQAQGYGSGTAIGHRADGHGGGNIAIGTESNANPDGTFTNTTHIGDGAASVPGAMHYRGHAIVDEDGNWIGGGGIPAWFDATGGGNPSQYNYTKAFCVDADGAGDYSVSVGRGADGGDYGTALGYTAVGYSCGTAVGAYAEGWGGGVAVGYNAHGSNGGVAIGVSAVSGGAGNVAIGENSNANPDGQFEGTVHLGPGSATVSGALHFHGHAIVNGLGEWIGAPATVAWPIQSPDGSVTLGAGGEGDPSGCLTILSNVYASVDNSRWDVEVLEFNRSGNTSASYGIDGVSVFNAAGNSVTIDGAEGSIVFGGMVEGTTCQYKILPNMAAMYSSETFYLPPISGTLARIEDIAANAYSLPTAGPSTLGGVKVGTGLNMTSGTLSVAYGSGSNNACAGNDTRLNLAATTHAATTKAAPVDADELPIVDSAASNGLKKLTWSNLKAALKTAFDALYAMASGYNTISFTAVKSGRYHIKGSATANQSVAVTDPSSPAPVEGDVYKVVIVSGYVSIGGVDYYKSRHEITRHYNGSAWETLAPYYSEAPDYAAAIKSTARTNLKVPGSDPTGITGATAITNIVKISQTNYNAIVTPDPNVTYIIIPG